MHPATLNEKVMRTFIMMIAIPFAMSTAVAQNFGIGVAAPTRAKLEVWGAAGAGKTSGYFDYDRGISLQRNYAAIGMNQYLDNTTYGRYMNTGHAAYWEFVHDDNTLSKGLSLNIAPPGNIDAAIPSVNKVWEFSANNRFRILSPGGGVNGILDVGRGVGVDGTALFIGSTYNSHFNYSTNEHTYIRAGKGASKVYLNDIPNGNVIFGNGSISVGINTNGYVPPTTLEVRQSNGGMELSNASYPNLPMEWRVELGSNPNFSLYYTNSLRTYFSPVSGSLNPVSDARLKTNVQPLPAILDKIMLLRPVTYKMKDAPAGQGRMIGFLAQNVQKLFPLLVSEQMFGTDMLGLNYAGFHVLAIKGIQEEQLKIEALEKGLSDIERRLQAIEQKFPSQQQ